MKTFFYTIISAFLGLQLSFAQVGIGTTTPDPNAALDVESTTQGVLIPRMLKAQRELIGGGSPAAGLLVYQTDDAAGFYFYNGTAWVSLTTVKPSGLESIDEGNGNGLVRVGRDPNNYGNIGSNAVDFSFSDALSTTYGATGVNSTAMGRSTIASGSVSTAMGSSTTASGLGSTAMGFSTTASGGYSTAMGSSTTSSGGYSTAMGSSTTASGLFSTAMGVATTASGIFSTAMGVSSTASGDFSTALGEGTQAESLASTALGRFNVGGGNPTSFIETDPSFEIGNGTSDSNRSNALTVLKNGNVGIGKTDPLQALDVVGSTAITDNLQVDNTTLFVNSVTNRVGIGTTDPLQALSVVGNAEVTGNLGIGTASPIAKLDVNGNAYVNGNVGVVGNAEINGAAIVTNNLQVDNTTLFVNASNNRVGIGTTGPLQALSVVGNAEVTGNLGIGTAFPLEKLDVNGNAFVNGNIGVFGNAEVTGNLGIGTASPLAKLDVNGNAYVNGNIGIGATNPSDKLVIEGGRLEVLADIDASSSPGTGSIEVANSLRIDANEIITNFSSTLYLQQGNNGNLVVDGNTIFVDALNDRVGIGTSSPSKTLDVRGQIIAVSDNSPALIVTGSSSSSTGDNGIISSNPSYSGSDLFLRSNDEVVVQIDFDNNESGNFQVENSSGTNLFIVNESGNATLSGTLTENSDRRLKKNIETIPYGLTEILKLQPKAYDWKAKDQEHKSLGLIAQEVQEVIENVVRIADDEDKTLSLSYTSLVPVLIKAIQEQQAIIDEQADKIKALEKQNQILKELEVRLEKLEAKSF